MKHGLRRFVTLLILGLITYSGFSQSETNTLKYDTKYYEAVDRWVAFPKTDSTFFYGFLYIDNSAGFTFDYSGDAKIIDNGLKVVSERTETISQKVRLDIKTKDVAILSNEQVSSLQLPAIPDWLATYKMGSDSVDFLKNLGYHYNHVGASHLALEPLKEAYEKEPHYKGLEFELAYAYNALKQYEKAIVVLDKAIENDPDEYYFYRELGFAYRYLDQLDKAETIYKKGISISDNDFEKSEMAVNMAQAYFLLQNREKFDEWAKITRKYAEKGSRYDQFIDVFEEKWGQEIKN